MESIVFLGGGFLFLFGFLGADTIFVQVVIKRNYENLQKKSNKKTPENQQNINN